MTTSNSVSRRKFIEAAAATAAASWVANPALAFALGKPSSSRAWRRFVAIYRGAIRAF